MRDSRWLVPADSLLAVDRVADEVRQAVLAGRLEPGVTLAHRAIGEQYRITSEIVQAVLSRLENEQLLVRRDHSFVVPPLRRDELDRLIQVWHAVAPDHSARLCTGLPRSAIDKISGLLGAIYGGGAVSDDEKFRQAQRLQAAWLGPDTRSWEPRTRLMVWQPMRRYIRIGMACSRGLKEPRRSASGALTLFDAFSRRSPSAVRAAMSVYIDQLETVSELALAKFDDGTRPQRRLRIVV
ncbi:MAG TPA: GntR family transcriptional regulator [Pseudonocardia sp.]|jgi:DNA-binding GntR family transcriptional regulator|uniref:GntR family transcriptional regulator n=1 Tax=Pseudonocardia sp. TaxID=60912 RepID=UPI002F425F5E